MTPPFPRKPARDGNPDTLASGAPSLLRVGGRGVFFLLVRSRFIQHEEVKMLTNANNIILLNLPFYRSAVGLFIGSESAFLPGQGGSRFIRFAAIASSCMVMLLSSSRMPGKEQPARPGALRYQAQSGPAHLASPLIAAASRQNGRFFSANASWNVSLMVCIPPVLWG